MNPWHDTPASAIALLMIRQVQIPLHYLLVTGKILQPIWLAYDVQAILQSNGIVLHTSGLFLIDSAGHEQTYFAEVFDPKIASQELRQLLAGSSAPAQASSTPEGSSSTFMANTTEQGYRIALTAM